MSWIQRKRTLTVSYGNTTIRIVACREQPGLTSISGGAANGIVNRHGKMLTYTDDYVKITIDLGEQRATILNQTATIVYVTGQYPGHLHVLGDVCLGACSARTIRTR